MISENQLYSNLYETRRGSLADPAVASGFTLEVPENGRSELIALTFRMVADANAANRYVSLRLIHGGNPIYLTSSYNPHTTGADLIYMLNQQINFQQPITTGYASIILPHYPALYEGDSLALSFDNIQVGDQISLIAFTWKRWLIR